jgi:EpsD family peptidyl-prolyl cis-trans isomerase
MKVVDSRCRRRTRATWTCVVLALAVFSGCGDGKERPAASQVAARVNQEDVTVHQVNHALQAQRGLRADQAEQAGSRVLEKLIDQELAVQKARSMKIDRDPKVLQQIEASRGEILARAYFEKIAEGVAKPAPEEVTAYYNAHPALFRERRIFQLQEISIQAKPPQVEAVRRIVAAGKPLEDVLIYLRANSIQYTSNRVVRAAEQVPLSALPALAKLRDGQSLVITGPQGAQVLAVTESRAQPIDEERARVAIEQFMVNDRKRRVVADDLKALRAAAKIEYVGAFAAPPPAGDAVPSVADAAASAARALPPAAAAPKPPEVAAPLAGDAITLDKVHINKGLGLK